jgi:hypothetical protein
LIVVAFLDAGVVDVLALQLAVLPGEGVVASTKESDDP